MKLNNGIKAKGRNGMFTIAQTRVTGTQGGWNTWVDVFSKRHGRSAPVMIMGDTEDVLQWAETLVKQIKGEMQQGSIAFKSALMVREELIPITLTRADWVEIYYALELKSIQPIVCLDRGWLKQLKGIIDRIGPDGDIAAAAGVDFNA